MSVTRPQSFTQGFPYGIYRFFGVWGLYGLNNIQGTDELQDHSDIVVLSNIPKPNPMIMPAVHLPGVAGVPTAHDLIKLVCIVQNQESTSMP